MIRLDDGTLLSHVDKMNEKQFLEYIRKSEIIPSNMLGWQSKNLLKKEIVIELCNKIISTKSNISYTELNRVNKTLRDNEEIIRLFFKIDNESLRCASKRLRSIKSLVLDYFTTCSIDFTLTSPLSLVSKDLRDDKTVVKAAIKQYGKNFAYASRRLRDDDELFKLAIKKDPNIYFYASSRIRSNKKFILEALTLGMSYGFTKKAPKKFILDKILLFKALNNSPSSINGLLKRNINIDKETIIFLFKIKHFNLLKYIDSFKLVFVDDDIVYLAIKSIFRSIIYGETNISNSLLNYKLEKLTKDVPKALGIITNNFNNKDIENLIKDEYINVIQKLSDLSKIDKTIIIDILKNNEEIKELLPPNKEVLHSEIQSLSYRLKKKLSPLSYFKYYNSKLSEKDIEKIGKSLDEKLNNGISLYELIDFFEFQLKYDFKDLITKQLFDEYCKYYNEAILEEFCIEKYVKEEHIVEAYGNSELLTLTSKLKEFLEASDGYLNACDYCNKFFKDSKFDLFLSQGREMLVCDCCWHLPEVQKASGQTNYEYVVSITDDPPICIFRIDKNSIDEIIEVLNTLKKIIDYGHSIEFVRVLSIDGHWNDETDYLLEYKPCVEKANNDGTIEKSDYEFFNKLLKTSNCESNMPLSVDHEVLQYIRLSY